MVLIHKNETKLKKIFRKTFLNYLLMLLLVNFWKMFGTVWNWNFFKKDNVKKIINQQSKLTFDGIHKSYENCDSYTFKQNQVVMDKAIYVGFAILELSKLHMKPIMIHYNHILVKKTYNYIIFIRMV